MIKQVSASGFEFTFSFHKKGARIVINIPAELGSVYIEDICKELLQEWETFRVSCATRRAKLEEYLRKD